MKWYENPRIFYDWARYGEDLTPDYAREVVQKALEVKADTLAFCVQIGGYALWDSQVTPRYPRMGETDLIGEMSRLCRAHDLHFVPWWLATATGGVERVLREHPSWQLLGPPREGGDQVRQNYICYNTPYREVLYEEVREVLTGYEVDGIYFDQLPGSCYCPWCQAKFERRFGSTMPVVADEFFVYNSPAGLPGTLKAFRDESVRGFCRGMRSVVDAVKPEVCYAQNWVRGVQSYLAEGLADVLLPEFYQRVDLVPLGLKQRLTKAYFNGGPIWGNVRHSVKHDARHHAVRATRMLLVECVANLSAPLMLDLCAMDFDRSGVGDLAETFEDMRRMQEVQAGAEPARYAALLHSSESHRLFADRFDEAFEGLYRLLLENHLPFEIVTEEGVQGGGLQGYRVLVLPDVVCLADETADAIRRAADGGMGVVATHMTGMLDGRGQQRGCPVLSEMMGLAFEDVIAHDAARTGSHDPVLKLPDVDGGIFQYASTRTGHPLAEGVGPMFSFQGGYVRGHAAEGAEVVAEVCVLDHARMDARPFNRRGLFPGPPRWPLIVVRESGSSRTVMVTGQVEAERRRAHAPELDELLARAVVWAGGEPVLTAPVCPRSVEVRVFHNAQDRAYQVMLVNLTTNPLVQVGGGPAVIRYVTPHRGLRLELRTGRKIRTVESQIGSEVAHTDLDGGVAIELPLLDLYESLVVKYE